jgi:hypothetical protein
MEKGKIVSILLISKREIAQFESGVIAVIMKPKILSWNVRGLNDMNKRMRISNLLRSWKVDIVCFQETKMVSVSSHFVHSLWGCPYVDWCHVDSRGQEEEVDMGEVRRWSVEAKEFEISIKGGLMGVRIVEKRNNRQRSVWVHRDELSWLVGAVEKAANVETSEVFWDQSRAGYIRLITQRRENRHGRFLTIEEFNGSRRCGSVLVPEGWSGRGWSKMIGELRGACSSLKIGRGLRREKPNLITHGSRSYAEVVGDTKRLKEKGTLTLENVGQIAPESEVERRENLALSIKLMSVPTPSPLGTVGYDQQNQETVGTNQEGGEVGPAHRSSVCSTEKKGEEPCKPRGSKREVECQDAQGKVKGRLESSLQCYAGARGF